MEVDKQLLLGIIMFICSYLYIICVIHSVKDLYLRRNERKRRSKGQTFKEWFFCSRYRDQIPRYLIWFSYIVLVIHSILLAFIFSAYKFVSIQYFTSIMTISIIVFDLVWFMIISILSWKPGSPWSHYEQWVPKPPKRKKKK